MSDLQRSFLTGGDVAPTRDEGRGMFGALAETFRAADVSFVNLENSLSSVGAITRGRERFHRGAPNNADGLSEAGMTFVNVANNHILDFGDDALLETFEALEERGIPYVGAGLDLARAAEPHIHDADGLRVGFLGYTTTLPRGFAATESRSGVNPLHVRTRYEMTRNTAEYPGVAPRVVTWTEPDDLERMRSDVRAVAARADVVLVYQHWGTSMTAHVHDFQSEIGRAAIDAGAHGVFGGHQHVIAGIEFHNGLPIVHGTGNLLFDTWEPFFTRDTLKTCLVGGILEPGNIRDVYAVPVKNGVNEPPLLLGTDDPMFSEIAFDLANRSRPFGTEVVTEGDRIAVRPDTNGAG